MSLVCKYAVKKITAYLKNPTLTQSSFVKIIGLNNIGSPCALPGRTEYKYLCQHMLATIRKGFHHTLAFSAIGGVHCHLRSLEM